MRIAIGSMQQETNTFSPRPTDLEDFEAGYLYFGRDVIEHLRTRPFEVGGAVQAATDEGIELVPILACWAMPSGRVKRSAYDALKEKLLAGLRAAGPLDGALIILHGAMVVDDIDDPEGDLLTAVRETLGPAIPVVASLDLHANITQRMVDTADGLVGYHTVPHIDHFDTGRRAARLLFKLANQRTRPVIAYRKLPMITPAEKHDTSQGPMQRLMNEVVALEREPGILAAGLYPVQPWLDVAELGWATVVVADGNRALAQEHADRLARSAWTARREFMVAKVPVDVAIRRALEVHGQPVVLSDTGDVSSGGAPGDSAALLAGLLGAGSPCTALLDIVDPPAVHQAYAAGEGATITVSLGGAVDRARQTPVTVTAQVKRLSDGRFTIEGPSLHGYRANLGRTAVLAIGPSSIVVHERGEMNVDPALYRSVGLDPLTAKIVQVKSPCGFRAAYQPVAADIILLDSPGCTTTDFATLPFRRAPRPLFPLDNMPDELARERNTERNTA